MDGQRGELLKAAMRIVELFYRGEDFVRSRYYEEGIEYITPDFKSGKQSQGEIKARRNAFRGSICRVIHGAYRIVMRTSMAAVITGSYRVVKAAAEGGEAEEAMDITVVLRTDGPGQIKARHIHISQSDRKERQYCIRDTNEQTFIVREGELLYLEAGHNHVVWHCKNMTVETAGSLKEAECMLPEVFLRIHRGFIVNRNHVRRISRCYAEIDNGDIIQIPVKKYCEVRKMLLSGESRIFCDKSLEGQHEKAEGRSCQNIDS